MSGIRAAIRDNLGDAIYGLNDGLGAIFGMIAGVAGYSTSNTVILVSGIFGALASMISMGAGAYQATQSDNKLQGTHRSRGAAALAGGLSTLVGGLFPLMPFFFLRGTTALITAAILCFIVQFTMGAVKTLFTHETWWKSGLSMMVIGMIVGVAGFLFGRVGQILVH